METREAYRSKLDARLKEWDAKLDGLVDRVHAAKLEARASFDKELASLKIKRSAAVKIVDDLNQHGESAWSDLKAGADKAWDELTKAMDSATARFK